MKNLIYSILLILFVSCTDASEDIKPDNNQDIVHYRFQTFLIQVDYSEDLIAPGSPAFSIIEKPNGGMFTTKHGYYQPDLYFKAPSIPGWAVFTIRGIYSRSDTIKFQDPLYGTKYLIRVKK